MTKLLASFCDHLGPSLGKILVNECGGAWLCCPVDFAGLDDTDGLAAFFDGLGESHASQSFRAALPNRRNTEEMLSRTLTISRNVWDAPDSLPSLKGVSADNMERPIRFVSVRFGSVPHRASSGSNGSVTTPSSNDCGSARSSSAKQIAK